MVATIFLICTVYVPLFNHCRDLANDPSYKINLAPGDELGEILEGASMGEEGKKKKTLIVTVLNKAYAEEGGMLDLFLKSFAAGENTSSLVAHILLAATDQASFDRCRRLGLHCYRLVTEGVDFSREEVYMSPGYISMLWRRILFLGEVLHRGYSFVFTDMDILWLRNPFPLLAGEGEDLQLSCDRYNGGPSDEANPPNTGFFFAAASNRTAALFDALYAMRTCCSKDQDVLPDMIRKGTVRELGVRVRYLDTAHFAGFCQNSGGFEGVRTVHANCCRSIKAKLADLSLVLEEWGKRGDAGGAPVRLPQHRACEMSWTEKM